MTQPMNVKIFDQGGAVVFDHNMQLAAAGAPNYSYTFQAMAHNVYGVTVLSIGNGILSDSQDCQPLSGQ